MKYVDWLSVAIRVLMPSFLGVGALHNRVAKYMFDHSLIIINLI